MGGAGEGRLSAKITLGGIIAAMAAAVMLAAYFPYLTYAVPAIAGLLIVVPMVEISPSWAWLTYISSSVVVLLTAENEAKLLFVLFFGYYPIIKALCEKTGKRWLEYLLKLGVFNAAVAAYVAISLWVLGIPASEFIASPLGAATAPALLLGGNVVFIIYDLGATRVISYYISQLHPRIRKILK